MDTKQTKLREIEKLYCSNQFDACIAELKREHVDNEVFVAFFGTHIYVIFV